MIYVGMPSYNSQIHSECVAGLISLTHLCASNSIGITMDVIPHDAFIGRARNQIAHRFLKSEFRDLMFIDADIGFDSMDVAAICKAEPAIVLGLYLMKEFKTPRYPAKMIEPIERNPQDPRLIRLQYGPSGFMRIRKEVFEAMKEKWPNDYYIDGENEKIYDFFPHGRTGNHFFGEDIAFCLRAQECGFDVWGMQGIELCHFGESVWKSNWQIDRAYLDEENGLDLDAALRKANVVAESL